MALVISQAPSRLAAFVVARFSPPVYVTYGVLWALSLEGSVALLAGEPIWSPLWTTTLRAASVVFALLFLRMVDEQKDLAYDRVHNPDRPLVTGAITAAELRVSMAVLAATGAAANLAVSVASALIYLAALGYGLLLAAVERLAPRVADGVLLNLVMAYPVQLVVSGYLLVSLHDSPGVDGGWRVVPLLLGYAGVFLHFEFARKTRWSGEQAERLYSSVLGPKVSAAVALGWLVVACVAIVVAFRLWEHGAIAWLVLAVAVALPLSGAFRFLFRRNDSWPIVAAMAFVLIVHVALIAQAVWAI